MSPRRVMVVDDEKGIRDALKQVLEYEEIQVQTCASGHEATRAYPEFKPHLVFLDVKMEGMDGLETLKKLREIDPQAQIVMISGHGTIQTAVEATQLGAYDFLEKPLDTDRILLTLRNALQHVVLVSENVRLKQEVRAQYEIVGASKAIKQVIATLEKVAPTPARVLITGENGTGKELVARAIHALSPRASGPFVEVNCAAIPTELIESELFGHIKGSFTGAFSDRAGKFELADGGTLFLDEIGDMSLKAQAKVLRALQEGVISRVGSGKSLPVDVRVIAATNKDLGAEINEGKFREDLLYRLNVVPIHVPPLRERRGDIELLIDHFSSELTKRGGLPTKEFAAAAVERLTAYDWPGNIRELKNAIERLLILATGSTVTSGDVERLVGRGEAGRGTGPVRAADASWLRAATFEDFKQAAERAYLLRKLQEYDWNVSETARSLQMPRSNLYKKIERYGLARGGFGWTEGATGAESAESGGGDGEVSGDVAGWEE
jgi:two-component system, NtrC family, nitrogen regulation response regulator NtrX